MRADTSTSAFWLDHPPFSAAARLLAAFAAVKGRNTKVAFSLRAETSTRCEEWKVTIAKTSVRNFLNCETFAAGTVSDGIGIGDLKAAFLQVFAVIEHRTADEKRALWIDDQVHILRRHENIALIRAIYQIHHVLQA